MHTATAAALLGLLLLTARGTAAEPPALLAAVLEDAAYKNMRPVETTPPTPSKDLLHAGLTRSPPEQPPEGPIAGDLPEHDRRQEAGRQELPRGWGPMGLDRLVAPPKHGPSAVGKGPSTARWPARSTLAEARSPAPPVMPAPRQLQEQGNGTDANGEPDCGDNAAFAALSARVMHSCCPSPAPHLGGRRQLQSAGNPVCWSGAFNAERCCDVAKGPTGDASCWSGTFDFSFCCPAPVTPAPREVDALCWTMLYNAERCCDVALGPHGDVSCWRKQAASPGSIDFSFCCPAPEPGEAETGSSECELPATCDSTECADEYLSYFDACYPHLSGLSPEVFRRFDAFKAGCEVSSPSLKLQPAPCFRACSCV